MSANTKLYFMCGKMGATVVLDFPGNTRNQRQWFRDLCERSNVAHELHYIDASDDVCKRQLRQRSEALPAGSAWTTDAEFDLITAYFQAPADDEGFKVVRIDFDTNARQQQP